MRPIFIVMLTIHHLNNSRSQRVLWLLEAVSYTHLTLPTSDLV